MELFAVKWLILWCVHFTQYISFLKTTITYLPKWLRLKTADKPRVDENVEQLEHAHVKTCKPGDLAVLLLGPCPAEMRTQAQANTCARMSILAAL